MKTVLAAAALALAALASSAQATTLLTLTDQGGANNYTLTFTGDGAVETLSVAGYNPPVFDQVLQNVVSTGGGPNVLGQTWAFTPAPIGSETAQFDDGSSVNGLVFGGVVVGDYDTYSQSFATIAGATYTYTFDYTGGGDPNSTVVSINGVPEPATWGLMLLGMGLMGAGLRTVRVKRGALAA